MRKLRVRTNSGAYSKLIHILYVKVSAITRAMQSHGGQVSPVATTTDHEFPHHVRGRRETGPLLRHTYTYIHSGSMCTWVHRRLNKIIHFIHAKMPQTIRNDFHFVRTLKDRSLWENTSLSSCWPALLCRSVWNYRTWSTRQNRLKFDTRARKFVSVRLLDLRVVLNDELINNI